MFGETIKIVIPKMTLRYYLQALRISNVWLVFALLLAILLSGCGQNRSYPQVKKGRLNLSGWDFNQSGPVQLEGEWEFYWDKLLEPTDFQHVSRLDKIDYIQIPGLWQGHHIDGKPLPAQGYATYRLSVSGLGNTEMNALYLSDVLSVGKIWINGELLASGGRVGKSKMAEQPQMHSLIVRFRGSAKPLEILLQVSNYHNIQGGINTPVWIGTDGQVQQLINQKWVVSGAVGVVLLIMGLCHLILFGIRRKEIANLYFGLYCILWAVQTLFGVNGGCLMAELFPSLPWRLSIDLTLLPYGFTIPLLVMFYHALFPNRRSIPINRGYQVLGGLFVLYLLVTPPNAFDFMVLCFGLVTLSALLYLLTMFIVDLIKKSRDIRFLIPGYLVLVLTIINDILYDLHLIDTAFLVPFGTFIFILSYSILISVRFSKAYSTVETLTQQLQTINKKELDRLDEQDTEAELKRRLAVTVMNALCEYWTLATQTSRIELADRSGLWSVYIEKDGWARTQTLDKYLTSSTLPVRPRWKNIISTARFVLSTCDKPHPLRLEIEDSLANLEKL